MIGNIQLLRGLAALSVVFYHTHYRILDGKLVYFLGVPLFFVISGFVMTYTTRDDASNFLTRRLIRIIPLYWAATLFSVAWFAYGLANPAYAWPLLGKWVLTDPAALWAWIKAHTAAAMTPTQIWAIARSLLFLPTDKFPVLGVGWTLNVEMYFYVIFAAALFVSKRWAPLLASAVILAVMALSRSAECGPVCYNYGHEYLPFFVSGMALFYVWRQLEPAIKANRVLTIVVSSLCFAAWPIGSIWAGDNLMVLYIVPPAVVGAALALHTLGLRLTDRVTLAFGVSSYALYLLHIIVIETLRSSGVPWLVPNTTTGLVATVLISVTISYWAYIAIEKPLMRALTARFIRSNAGSETPQVAIPHAAQKA